MYTRKHMMLYGRFLRGRLVPHRTTAVRGPIQSPTALTAPAALPVSSARAPAREPKRRSRIPSRSGGGGALLFATRWLRRPYLELVPAGHARTPVQWDQLRAIGLSIGHDTPTHSSHHHDYARPTTTTVRQCYSTTVRQHDRTTARPYDRTTVRQYDSSTVQQLEVTIAVPEY